MAEKNVSTKAEFDAAMREYGEKLKAELASAAEAAERAVAVAEKEAEEAAAAFADGLVMVVKSGERMFVHAACVAAHMVAGWKLPD